MADESAPQAPGREEVARLYAENDYMEAYRRHTDLRVRADPHDAVGGMWEEIGGLQFDYLVGKGLKPDHRLLDIGCGTLRGGRHFIRYLDPGGYTGLDISPEALAYAGQLIRDEGLAAKQPELVLDRDMRLRFEEFDRPFDFLLAQSVFTHLPIDGIAECFENLHRVMGPASAFYFTYVEAPEPTARTQKDFSYPLALFEELARWGGLRIEGLGDFAHPRGQVMARATPATG